MIKKASLKTLPLYYKNTNKIFIRTKYSKSIRPTPEVPSHEFHKIIKLVRPEIYPDWVPQKSGDLQKLTKFDPNWIRPQYQCLSHIIEKLPEEKRKVFTCAFASRSESVQYIKQQVCNLVKRHKYDEESLEYKIAHKTVEIRSLQEMFERNMIARTDIRTSVRLIEERKECLDKLRNLDYKRFEWIINVLGLIYKPNAPPQKLYRKPCLVRLTELYCEAIKEKKLNDYAEALEDQKIPFLQDKLSTLQQIKKDEEEMNLPSSVDQDIEQTKARLESLTKSNNMMNITPLEDEGKKPESDLIVNKRGRRPARKQKKPDLALYTELEITRPWRPTDLIHMPKTLYGKGNYPKKGIIPSKTWI